MFAKKKFRADREGKNPTKHETRGKGFGRAHSSTKPGGGEGESLNKIMRSAAPTGGAAEETRKTQDSIAD